jgi:phosphohistidine phosphatase
MKTLYLVRHAKSSWDNPQLRDFDRPLNDRGKRDAPRMGAWLKEMKIRPDLILTSPARRAFTTARILRKVLELDDSIVGVEERLYLASPGEMLQVIAEVNQRVDHLFLVGHNPGHTDLANQLSEARIDNLPTVAIFAVSFDMRGWHELKPGMGRFLFFQYPKNLE